MPQGWVGYLRSGEFFPPHESLVIEGLQDVKRDADAERRRLMELRVDLFRDDFLDQLRIKLGTEYEIENFSEIFKTIDKSNNACKKIVTSISTLYDDPPAWKLAKDDGGNWDQLRKQSNYNLVMPAVNQYTNLCNEALVFVCVIRGRIRYHLLTPDLVRVWQNPEDPTTIDAFAYQSVLADTPEQRPVWFYWSNGGPGCPPIGANDGRSPTFAALDSLQWSVKPDPATARLYSAPNRILHQEANPYRDENGQPVLPVVVFHRSHPISEFWDATSGDDIVSGTLDICVMESLINHLFRIDSAQIKYVKGELAPNSMIGQVGGLQRFLTFRSTDGSPIDVGQFKSQSDWKGLRDAVITPKLNNLSNNYGLSAAAIELTGTPQSGFALKVRKEPLLEIRKRQIPLFREADRELYAVTAAVWNYERANARGDASALGTAPAVGKPLLWPSEADPTVTYGEYHEPKTVQERETEMELDQVEMSIGLVNVLQLMQRRHPEMTLLQAENAIRENLAINRKLNAGTQLVIGRAQVLPIADQSAGAPVGPGQSGQPGGAPLPPAAVPSKPPSVPVQGVQYDAGREES